MQHTATTLRFEILRDLRQVNKNCDTNEDDDERVYSSDDMPFVGVGAQGYKINAKKHESDDEDESEVDSDGPIRPIKNLKRHKVSCSSAGAECRRARVPAHHFCRECGAESHSDYIHKSGHSTITV